MPQLFVFLPNPDHLPLVRFGLLVSWSDLGRWVSVRRPRSVRGAETVRGSWFPLSLQLLGARVERKRARTRATVVRLVLSSAAPVLVLLLVSETRPVVRYSPYLDASTGSVALCSGCSGSGHWFKAGDGSSRLGDKAGRLAGLPARRGSRKGTDRTGNAQWT